ncbi:hypothetical protein A9R05_17335 [Burkholderia sp. KK1]|nr:hypothetical protein A9R05_17335 [Burkholderia sp. KK1]
MARNRSLTIFRIIWPRWVDFAFWSGGEPLFAMTVVVNDRCRGLKSRPAGKRRTSAMADEMLGLYVLAW